MQRYTAFLGGINVGGHRVTGDVLRSHFGQLGFSDVATFLASGNVVFASDPQPVDTLRTRIEEHLATQLGYAVPTFLRTAAQVCAIAEHQPFPAKIVAATAGKLQVGLLARAPEAAAERAVLDLADDRDRLAIAGTELYWLPSGGMSDSLLDLKAAYTAVGPWTMRTVNTVRRIAVKYFASREARAGAPGDVSA